MFFFLITLAVLFFIFLSFYNQLIAKKNQVKNAYAGIDVQFKKRFDLIPNLVSTVQQYMKYESETLNQLTSLRVQAQSNRLGSKARIELDNEVSQAMGSIMASVENYPELKASENFLQLQRSFNEIEAQLSAARRTFNASTTEYNDAIEMFPTNILANFMGYKQRSLFEIDNAERQVPNAKNLFEN